MSRGVLVTGASRGIGRAIARTFAEAGDRVAVHYGRSRERAEQVADELPGDGHVVVQADLADPEAVRAMVDTAAERLDGLDVLVNNAGIFVAHPPLSTSYEQWQERWAETLATNLTGAANATFCAVPHLREAGGGTIVNVTSRGAFRGEPANPAYGASKAGLNAFTQSMALALAPLDIRVAAVAPGFVQTEMAREVLDGPGGDAVRSPVPLRPGRAARGGRLGGPLARLRGGAVLHRHHHRRQRRLLPAQLSHLPEARYGTTSSLPVVRRASRSSCARWASSSGYRPPTRTSSAPEATCSRTEPERHSSSSRVPT